MFAWRRCVIVRRSSEARHGTSAQQLPRCSPLQNFAAGGDGPACSSHKARSRPRSGGAERCTYLGLNFWHDADSRSRPACLLHCTYLGTWGLFYLQAFEQATLPARPLKLKRSAGQAKVADLIKHSRLTPDDMTVRPPGPSCPTGG